VTEGLAVANKGRMPYQIPYKKYGVAKHFLLFMKTERERLILCVGFFFRLLLIRYLNEKTSSRKTSWK